MSTLTPDNVVVVEAQARAATVVASAKSEFERLRAD